MDQENASTTVETASSCDKESIDNPTESTGINEDSPTTSIQKNTSEINLEHDKVFSDNSSNQEEKTNQSSEKESGNKSEKVNQVIGNSGSVEQDIDVGIEIINENVTDEKKETNKSELTNLEHETISTTEKEKVSEHNESENEKSENSQPKEKEKDKSTEINNDKNTDNLDTEPQKVIEVDIERTETSTGSGDMKETDSVKNKKNSPTDVDSDTTEKEGTSSDKHDTETENTEFVHIVQDKQDESHIEGQSIEAEDPFGGDNITAEAIETDELEVTNMNFCRVGNGADNLQDVINANNKICESSLTDNEETSHKNNQNEDVILEPSKTNINNDNNELSAENKSCDDNNQVTSNEDAETNSTENSKTDGKELESSNKEKKKNDSDDVVTVTTEEQSTVLPGQDDELCIIPDSMKIILPPPTGSQISRIKVKNADQISEDSCKITELKTAEEVVLDSNLNTAEKETDSSDKNSDQLQTGTALIPVAIDDNIIDIDDEAKSLEIEEIRAIEICKQCKKATQCNIKVKVGAETYSVCSNSCKKSFTTENNKATDIPSDGANSKFEKRCAGCLLIVEPNDDRNLSWETMEFCNEECLGKFQTKYGSYCKNCNGNVTAISLGKYCVRFGYDVRQFCCSSCLEEFKKGLKVCSYCQKDISSGTDGFLAPVGEKGQFKDFCTQFCMEKYSKMNSTEPPIPEKKACSVCQEEKIVHCEVQIERAAAVAICSEPCFAAFKFVNKVDPDQCSTCKKYFDKINKKSTVVFYNNEAHTFCGKTCLNIFIITHRKIVPCNWCKVKKYNFDMIKKELKNGTVIMMCSLNCLTLYQVSMNAVSARRINCNFCKEYSQAQYHLTMSDATIRNFCSYDCVMKFQGQYAKAPITIPAGDDAAPVPTGTPKRTYPGKIQAYSVKKTVDVQNLPIANIQNKKTLPVISSVASLASNGQTVSITQKPTSTVTVAVNNASITNSTPTQTQQVIYKQQVITRPPSPVKVCNKVTQCKPIMHTKGVSAKPHPCTKSTQTDDIPSKIAIPIPVPIYVPFPVHMWSFPFPVPVPVPLPIPVPIFIPTTRNSAKGIFKEIKRIQEKMPADPFEAELLMMAEMVATEKKKTESDSDSEEEAEAETTTEPAADSNNTFGEDMLQIALKMATGEIEESAVDLEVALTPNTITASQNPAAQSEATDSDTPNTPSTKGRKRTVSYKSRSGPTKKGRRASANNEPCLPSPSESQTPPAQPPIIEPIEKPDANMALKYTFGVNAWRKWVVAKNTELEKQNAAGKKVKLFKSDLLQLTADELNYSLCLFVKEVRKPNGSEYAPDTIYYLCLGIQQYLFENNRIDNIFTDTYYEQFTDCLNDIAKKFSVLYNDAQYIVTRVEEEHLWECKQLGAHSPHVLLSTLMFFNTKHFNLTTVEEHMQLSFSHIMKHWKRNPATQTTGATGKTPGSRNVLLRFYPPQAALDANSKKKKVYEQQENEENPLRCPVKLYEFYLSKCPESVKTRNDVFYLLPERSCVPDSPVWYSTSPLGKEHLIKMLNRVKMVKEINIALLST
ncbi:zinc finger MYM-type protein 3 [Chelonus insularis]|uniref:zinc finger MYM-type protein 3 n=1 Tax=Chelonus insularis TaxID=460826 RepID=UPI00158DE84D|nr:zinc finger MYM-type protein 3 [Chelonus insularis]XP_034948571.1 zinc finger MYM-type protein 3 [Chelonus insularis]